MYEQRLQFRRDTVVRWTSINPILADGEPGYEIDTGKWKIGDGFTDWNSLGYMAEDGLQGPVGPVGPAGAASTVQGPAGPKGADSTVPGPATTITIGTVTAGTIPADAAASMSGTSPNQVLNLVLPKGDTGSTGAKGDQGVQGVGGVQGSAGPVGPQGPQGLAGPAGPKGDAAGINIKGTATTWPPAGSPANDDLWLLPDPIPAGTPSSYKPGDGIVWTGTVWLNVGPVRGPAGPEGPAGPVGPQGSQGIQGVQGVEGPQGAKGDRGDVGPSGPQGPQGVKGDTGAAGADAPPSNLTIGTVIEGPIANASITGTSPNFILNLTLPQPSLTHVTTFTVNPQNQTVEDGDSVTLTAGAQSTGTNIVYKWQRFGIAWEDIPGAGGKTYTFNATTALNGRQYRCYASTPEGAVAASMAAVLTVLARPPSDGTSWEVITASVTGPVSAANGRLFADQKYSLDGINWLDSNMTRSTNYRYKKVAYGNGFFFDGRYYSNDGINFSDGTKDTTLTVTSLCFDGSEFVFHANKIGHQEVIRRTSNGFGVTTEVITGISANEKVYFQFSYGSKFFGTAPVPGRAGKSIFTSSNGAAWTKMLDLGPEMDILKNCIFGYEPSIGEKYIITARGNKAWTSKDAATWTERILPTTGVWVDLAFGNGLWMLISAGSTTCLTSPDAINWTIKNSLPSTGVWDSVAFATNKFVAHRTSSPFIAISG